MRPAVSVYLATSIDGFIAREDGDVAWLDRVDAEGQDYGYAAFMATVDAMLIGRGTYDVVMGFGAWPYEGKRVGVLTHRPLSSDHGEEAVTGALGPVLAGWAAEGVRRVYLDGGVTVRQGLAEGVVDDLTLSVIPVILGRGIPLFGAGVPESDWRLTSSEGFPSGLVQLRYARG